MDIENMVKALQDQYSGHCKMCAKDYILITDKLRSQEAKIKAADELAKTVEKYTVGNADFNDLYRTTDAYRNSGKDTK